MIRIGTTTAGITGEMTIVMEETTEGTIIVVETIADNNLRLTNKIDKGIVKTMPLSILYTIFKMKFVFALVNCYI